MLFALHIKIAVWPTPCLRSRRGAFRTITVHERPSMLPERQLHTVRPVVH